MDVLDQTEVDQLLAAVETGAIEEEDESGLVFTRDGRANDDVEVNPYDFKRPERVSKDQMRALHTLHETFARSFGVSLSGFLRTIVEVKVATCEQMTYAEFISGLPNPTSFNLIETDALEGQVCLEVSPLIIYPIIDRLLGGSSQDLFIPQRPMTVIETRLIGQITNRGLASLAEAWSSVRELEFKIVNTESNPQLVQIVPPNEVVVVVGFELKLGNRAGTMNLCIPYNVIEPVMDDLSTQNWFTASRGAEPERFGAAIRGQIEKATVRVTGQLAETSITVADLRSLRVGDLLLTETPASADILVCVEGEKKFLSRAGQFRGSRALRIERSVTSSDRV